MQIATKSILHTLIWLVVPLAVASLVFVDDYAGNRFRHFSMEMISVLLCLASVMFFITLAMGGKYKLLPYIGMAFLATGIVDIFHALVSMGVLIEPQAQINRFIPGSWTAGRVITGLILLYGLLNTMWAKTSILSLPQHTIGIILLSILVVAVFTVADLPAFIRVEADYLNRPWEILAIGLYLLFMFLIRRNWSSLAELDKTVILYLTPFMTLSIIYEAIMVHSPVLYDPSFDAAHFIKIISFAASFFMLGVIVFHRAKQSISTSWFNGLSIIAMAMMAVLMISVVQISSAEYQHSIQEEDRLEIREVARFRESLHGLRGNMLGYLVERDNKYIIAYEKQWSLLQQQLGGKWLLHLEVEYNTSFSGLLSNVEIFRDKYFTHAYSSDQVSKSSVLNEINSVFEEVLKELEAVTRGELSGLRETGETISKESHEYLVIQLIALLLILPIFYIYGLFTNRKLLDPVLELTDFTEKVKKGIFVPSTTPGKNVVDNEIGLLYSNVNEMVSELHDDRLHLENEVSKRTNELKTSEQRMQQFFSAATEGLIFHKEGVILDVNVSATKIIGYRPEEILGKNFLELVPKKYHAVAVQRIAEQTESLWEIQVVHKLGHLVDIEVQTSTAEYLGEQVRIVSVRDISERIEVEKKALLLGEELEQLIETANAPIFGVDKKGFINEWNNKIAELTGYDKDEAMHCHLVNEFIHKDYKLSVQTMLNQALQNEKVSNQVVRIYTKYGGRLMLLLNTTARRDIDNNIARVVGFGQDITELDAYRLGMERKVEERTRELNAIFTLSPDGFVLFDGVDKIAYVNPAFLSMTGFSKESLIHATREEFSEMLYSLIDDDPNNSERKLCDTDTDTVILELARPDKKIISCASRLMHDTYGVFQGLVLYFRDVTHEAEVDRMKSEFLSTAAHELRTPLASIYGFSELLMERDYDEGTSRELYEIIHRQSSGLVKLVNELLDLARIEDRSGKGFNIVRTPLNAVIDLTAAPFKLQSDKHQLTMKLMDDVDVYADADKLEQALANVIGNAYKYSPKGGKINITIFIDKEGTEDRVGISITDHGIGMDEVQLSRIYDRFYRADNTGKIPGTGLGMSLVKEIIEVMGGSVQVESELGKGTAVTLWLKPVKTNYHEEAKA